MAGVFLSLGRVLPGRVIDDVPAYAWSPDDRQEWKPPPLSLTARAMKAATAPR
jgi:hypothetical protein